MNDDGTGDTYADYPQDSKLIDFTKVGRYSSCIYRERERERRRGGGVERDVHIYIFPYAYEAQTILQFSILI